MTDPKEITPDEYVRQLALRGSWGDLAAYAAQRLSADAEASAERGRRLATYIKYHGLSVEDAEEGVHPVVLDAIHQLDGKPNGTSHLIRGVLAQAGHRVVLR